MTEQESKKQKYEETIGIIFMICFGLGCGYYLSKEFDTKADIKLDFERKAYIPYEINGELYLINSKNGKTYLLEKHETNDDYWYEYKFLAKTKTKKIKIYDKKNPLNLAF